ncbi:Him1p Ecym_8185 [Eremothecium cymbalariae DBVPG|uniref:Uncharacterized protein n=1 Tax=Eremothecium cymbalariae (strain CBS 270.75 / DBVPG 7215 / KCTC 17166 / NRRL Y-17582) TaxID=931890 RepID=G8JX97_ERECY|nr:Hypothetical protein Ecym_8185 [Eremothecium cymbalariae DBVPG\
MTEEVREPPTITAFGSVRTVDTVNSGHYRLSRKTSLHYQDIKIKIKSTRNKLFKHDQNQQIISTTTPVNSPPPPEDSSAAKAISVPKVSINPPKVNEKGDNVIILGSTGLTGSQVLKGCMAPWTSGVLYDLKLTKNIWCFNRRLKTVDFSISKLPPTWTAVVNYGGEPHIIRKYDLKIKQHITEIGKLDGLEFQWDQFDWELKLPTDEVKNVTVNVFQIIQNDSKKWDKTFSELFTGNRKPLNDRIEVYLPSIDQVETLISTLGSSSWESRKMKTPRSFVDYTLNMDMAKVFAPDQKKSLIKHMVIVTSFNNLALGVLSPYFRTKQKLENDLTYDVPGLTHLTILRPGPLIGQHGKQIILAPQLPVGSGVLYKCYAWKRSLLKAKLHWLSQVKDVGPSKKVTELIAKATYHLPGNWIVGYSIPSSKVARIAAKEAMTKRNLARNDSDALVVEVTLWSSQEMDRALSGSVAL